MVRFPEFEWIFSKMTRIRNRALRSVFTLVFGFWKLYCYETRIFKRPGSVWLFGSGALPRFAGNAALGLKMMFPGRRHDVGPE